MIIKMLWLLLIAPSCFAGGMFGGRGQLLLPTAIYNTNIVANSGTISGASLAYVNTMVSSLKAQGLWTKINLLAPVCGGELTGARILLKMPFGVVAIMANSGTFVNGDYTETGSSGGIKGDGTGKYLDTAYNPSAQSDSLSSFHLAGYWRGTESAATTRLVVGNGTAGNFTELGWITAGTREGGLIAGDATLEPAPASSGTSLEGFLLLTVNGNRNQTYYSAGSVVSTAVTASGGYANINIYAGCLNNNGTAGAFTTRYMRFISIGTGLSSTDAANYYTVIQAFQTALGRQL